jgi:histidyl-tRNA synthetase
MFRAERPQAGRYRQFHQFGFECFGSAESIIDAQLIVIANQFFKELGIEVVMQINSIGTPETRREYEVELANYFRAFRSRFDEDDKRRLQKNPLRLLDSKAEYIVELLPGAPQIVDWLDEESKNHFMSVIEFLDAAEVPYALNSHLVRGLDYYNRTVFEIWPAVDEGQRAQNALGGGGRYDGLVELLGGREQTAGCGFAVGMERVAALMRERGLPGKPNQPKIFMAQLGDASRRAGLKLFEELRQSGLPVVESFGKNALKTQLDLANKLGVVLTLILGQKEVLDGTIIIRDMESGGQEIVDAKKIVDILKKKLAT